MTTIALTMADPVNVKVVETFRKESKRLQNFIRQRVPTTEDAEDILQDVMYEFVNSFRVMRPVEQVASWLFTVARNRITDFYRKKRPDLLDDHQVGSNEEGERLSLSDMLPANDGSPEAMMMNDLIMKTITESLAKLPKDQREVFVMHELEDKSFQEIAEITGANLNTLLSRKRYAVLFLRTELQELYEDLFKK
ncbi:MAG: sigma-70 family RNA polymerase sigma factor [Chitinophagales bacterium]